MRAVRWLICSSCLERGRWVVEKMGRSGQMVSRSPLHEAIEDGWGLADDLGGCSYAAAGIAVRVPRSEGDFAH